MTMVSEGVGVQSFEGFVEATLPRLVRFARWVSGPTGDAEDLVHDALVRAGSRWHAIASRPGDAEAYVRRAIVNGHVSRWRARRREHLVDVLPESAGTPAEEHRHSGVWQAVQALPRGQRAVVALRFFEDMTVDESARVLGVSEGTVKTQTHRALHGLRRALVADGLDESAVLASAASAGPGLVTAMGAPERVGRAATARRNERIAARAAGAVAAVAAIVGILVWSPWSGIDRVQPVVPAPSVEQSTAPVVSATAPSGTTSTPNEDGAVRPSATRSSGATPRVPVTLDLAAYRFEIEESVQAEAADALSRNTDVASGVVLDPCRPTEYPTDEQRTGFLSASTYVGDSGYGAVLASYPSPAVAAEVLAGYTRALQACGRLNEAKPAVGSNLVQWSVLPPPPLGQESLAVLSTEYISEFGLPGSDIIVVRIEQYVLIVYTDSFYAGDPAAADRMTQVTELATTEAQRLQQALATG